MPRGNIGNLKPNSERTPEEIKANCSKAGKKSGESRRRKRDMQGYIRAFLDDDGGILDGKKATNEEVIALGIIKAAKKQDWKAVELMLSLSGQKPKDDVSATATAVVNVDVSAMTDEQLDKILGG